MTCVAILSASQPAATEPPIQNPSAPIVHLHEFAGDPALSGWEQFGDSTLNTWTSTNQNLHFTWDSSKPNTYLRFPLGTILSQDDDFHFELDLLLLDVAVGIREGFPGTFQVAFGFQNRADADKNGFIRGTGSDSPNLAEFNYFPDTGFGATVWPVMTLTNGTPNYNGPGDFGIFDLPVGLSMNVAFAYTAADHTARLTIRTNGAIVGHVVDAPLMDLVRGFRLDAFAIASYSDAGQNSAFPGSILAHGIIDNVRIGTPPPPIQHISMRLEPGEAIQEFISATGWRYRVETSSDLITWTQAGLETEGTGQNLAIRIPNNPAVAHQFYRVRAER